MTPEKALSTCRSALLVFGIRFQREMVIEECSELIQAVQKWKRALGKSEESAAIDHLCEELADVDIMITQMKIYFGEDQIEKHKQIKLTRLENRVEQKVNEQLSDGK